MTSSWKAVVAVLAIAALAPACSHRGGATYSQGETGTVMRVEAAKIVSSREVLISGLDNQQAAGWGTAVGATIAGAAAYGLTGADNPAGVAVTIIAAVVGGLTGLVAEEQRETRRGAEYILNDPSGKKIAVVQSLGSGEPISPPGTPVSLIYNAGGYVRVVPAAS
jgi:outer membrane lipoprotein SlyB